MNNTGYVVGGSSSTTGSIGAPEKGGYWPLSKCRKAYLDYLANKQEEVSEQKDARRYYHGAQWTDEQIKALNKRKQPVVTFNRIGRKINGVVGLIERLRQDPKAYPRTPKHEEGAELATAVIRYVLDEQEWKAKSPEVALDGAIDGYAGIEIELEQGDQGDYEVAFDVVEPDSFFYDPRSYRADFSDARYMGMGKWVDVETAQEMFPDKAGQIEAIASDDSELSSNPDRENKWFSFDGSKQLIRLVDVWYKHKGKWCWTLFTGSLILAEGESYLFDEKNQTICKYVMFSCNVDHDGDRYGFVRNMKSAQDEYNARRSRALFTANSRRLLLGQGAVQDVEKARQEWARPDGVVVVNTQDVTTGAKADDASFDFAGQLKLMENAIAELENYGPNQALIGDVQNQSGRAIQLLQQAGMAELGPYIMGYRGWKIRVYRALFSAVQKYWTKERWIRVTDDDGLAQFIQLNGIQTDPMTGQSTLVNAIGSLDVDIIMDEGADTINAQQDVYETLSNVLPTIGPMLKPQEASAAVGILIDASALDASAKKKWRDATKSQPDPMAEKAKEIQLAGEAAKVEETQSKALLNKAKAQEAVQPEAAAPMKPEKPELPMEVQIAQALADIEDTQAAAQQKRSQAFKTDVEANLAPAKAEHEASLAEANFEQGIRDREADRKIAAKQKAPK
jgi:hypothetical protein